MPRAKELSKNLRSRIVDLHKAGKGYKTISRSVSVHLSTVREIIYKWRKFRTVATLPRCGRPLKSAKAQRVKLKKWSEPVVVPAKKSVGTQLSAGTLRYHRSKGVQTSEKSISRGTGLSEHIREVWSLANHVSEPSPAKKMCVKEEEEEERISGPHLNVKYEARNSDASDQSDLESEYGDAKYIVSASSLRELFERCPICTKHCKVKRRRRGLLLSFSQKCPHCSYKRRWQSEMDELLQVPVTDDNVDDCKNESDNEILSKKDVLSAHVVINQH